MCPIRGAACLDLICDGKHQSKVLDSIKWFDECASTEIERPTFGQEDEGDRVDCQTVQAIPANALRDILDHEIWNACSSEGLVPSVEKDVRESFLQHMATAALKP